MQHRWPAFREVPYMGVIHVVAEAAKLGFTNGHPDWSNLGHGQPEVGTIEGTPPRLDAVQFEPIDHAYGPVGGTTALRQAVADHYNRLFRRDSRSKYGPENVAIAAGGRLALSRLLSVLSELHLGYQTPDYTANEDMLAAQSHRVTPIHVPTTAADEFKVSPERLATLVHEQQLGGYLISNSCNPTGQLVEGEELRAYVQLARETGCELLLDEFYSHIYERDGSPAASPVSAAKYVDDVERDPVLLIDGLTKNYRYPGWRVGWIVGPSGIIEQINRAASSIDGGPPATTQRAALTVLEPARDARIAHRIRSQAASYARCVGDHGRSRRLHAAQHLLRVGRYQFTAGSVQRRGSAIPSRIAAESDGRAGSFLRRESRRATRTGFELRPLDAFLLRSSRGEHAHGLRSLAGDSQVGCSCLSPVVPAIR